MLLKMSFIKAICSDKLLQIGKIHSINNILLEKIAKNFKGIILSSIDSSLLKFKFQIFSISVFLVPNLLQISEIFK